MAESYYIFSHNFAVAQVHQQSKKNDGGKYAGSVTRKVPVRVKRRRNMGGPGCATPAYDEEGTGNRDYQALPA